MRKILINLLLALFLVLSGICANAFAKEGGGGVAISYLKSVDFGISAHEINRLHFARVPIVRIVGDTSKYEAVLDDNGFDLFLSSKVVPSEVISLTVILANGRAIDLRLRALDQKQGVVLNINSTDTSREICREHDIAGQMINDMAAGRGGKYFVKKLSGEARIAGKPHLMLRHDISYRYGDFTAIGFKFSSKSKNSKLVEAISKEEIAHIFKNVVAVGLQEDLSRRGYSGRLFVVTNPGR